MSFFTLMSSAEALMTTEEIAKEYTSAVMLVQSAKGTGTGFVVASEGVVITNYHVIESGGQITAKSHNGGLYNVTSVLSYNAALDIAALKIDAKNLDIVNLDDSASVKPGSEVVVIGNPAGLESTVSEGIVSAKRTLPSYEEVIQITAPISPGSSGSPVFNKDGKVIGIATFKVVAGESLNFAVPSNQIKEVWLNAKKEGKAFDAAFINGNSNSLAKGSPEQDASLAASDLFRRIKNHEAAGKHFEMLSDAKNAVQLYQDSALAHRLLSDAFFYIKLNEDALSSAKRAIELDPKNTRAWNNLALILKAKGDDSGAVKVLQHAIKVAPNDAKLLIDYATLMSSSDSTLARGALNAAFDLLIDDKGTDQESEFYALRTMLVTQMKLLGDSMAGYKAAEVFLATKPDEFTLWIAKALVALDVGYYNEVRPSLSQANKINPQCQKVPELHQIVGRLETKQNNPVAAVAAFKKAYELGKRDPASLEELIYAICSKPYITREDIEDIDKHLAEIAQSDEDLADEIQDDILPEIRKKRY